MLFIYGTLQDADVLGAVLGRKVAMTDLRRATAPGYRVVTHPGRVYPALVAAVGEVAGGLLLEDLSALDIAVLDAFEGVEYRRHDIAVHSAGRQLLAEAFLPVSDIAASAPAWSLAEWTVRHKADVLGSEAGLATALRQTLGQPG